MYFKPNSTKKCYSGEVNIGSDNGLAPKGDKPLSEPMIAFDLPHRVIKETPSLYLKYKHDRLISLWNGSLQEHTYVKKKKKKKKQGAVSANV